jgi:CRISPR-associated protein Cmr6
MNKMLQYYYERLSNTTNSLTHVNKFKLCLATRLVVGLGAASVYETAIQLHHLYGFPYIPSTALKGITRHYIIMESFSKDEDVAINDVGFQRVFGYQLGTKNYKGEVCFFNAFPKPNCVLELDVMTPHFLKYYTDNLPPTDDQDPIPIKFLTISPSTEFHFIIGDLKPKSSLIDSGHFKGKKPLELARKWIIEALTSIGVGAKTALGYGCFEQI